MHVLSDVTKDIQHSKPHAGSYEWWYFDGISEEGDYQLVVIFYDGCPFSTRYMKQVNRAARSADGLPGHKQEVRPDERPGVSPEGSQEGRQDERPDGESGESAQANPGWYPNDHPAISISIYHKGKPVFYSLSQYPPEQCSFDPVRPAVAIGDNSLRMEKRKIHGGSDFAAYDLRINEQLPNGEELKGIITFTGMYPYEKLLGAGSHRSEKQPQEGHIWNLAAPRMDMQCRINMLYNGLIRKELKFDGTGYHDHNLGLEPMKYAFRDWYWGRVHFQHATLVYYVMNRKGGERDCRAWLLSPDNRRLLHTLELTSLRKRRPNGFMLWSARRLTFADQELKITVQHRKAIDSGPFYCRYTTRAVLEHPGIGVEKEEGLGEYIRPHRIHQRRYWPLVHMRLRYVDQKPHWVQKSRILYRWTW